MFCGSVVFRWMDSVIVAATSSLRRVERLNIKTLQLLPTGRVPPNCISSQRCGTCCYL